MTESGEYNLLNFKKIDFVDTNPDFDGNRLETTAHTYPYVATLTEIVDDLLAPKISVITSNYTESAHCSFTPKPFWYVFVYPFPYMIGSLPVDYNVTTTGFDTSGRLVMDQAFEFKANRIIIQDRNLRNFNGVDNVSSVAFAVQPVIVATLVDYFVAKLELELAQFCLVL